jgi:glutamate/tyrosine decarboxylase-like PLP-dependent enzyme
MRTLGYRAVDAVVDRAENLADRPVLRRWTREQTRGQFDEPLPCTGQPPLAVLGRVVDEILPACAATDHPRFLSFVPGPSNYVSAVADFLASGHNVFAGNWLAGPGPAEVELTVLNWLREMVGLPDGSGGILTSGGSQATLICVHAARARLAAEKWSTCRVYVSDQTHASIVRGLRFLGFAADQVVRLPTGAALTLDPETVRRQVTDDLARGLAPLCLIATAGTTSTGAVDPLSPLADVCAELNVWLHVDAAYGAAAVLTENGRRLLHGLDRADSIAVDPHKWWFQPYEIGCALVRDEAALSRAFHMHAEYLTETRTGNEVVNFYDRGPQLTRAFRALKLWMTLQVFGVDAMAEAVASGMALAEQAEALLRQRPGWEVVTPAQLAVVTFRPVLPDLTDEQVDTLTTQLAEDTVDDGYALVLTTRVGDRPVLRWCTIHPELTLDDLSGTLEMLDRLVLRRR